MTNATEEMQETGESEIGTWSVGVEVVCEDRRSRPIYIEGREVPQRVVSDDLVSVNASSLVEARRKAAEFVRQNYEENFTNIAFYNTHRVSSIEDINSVVKFSLLRRK